ncbi:hypothetical protein LWI29_027432 [Acer saccharum]|uniref:Uncharacterized protein n=1 Tax=Acer saccharum TaxID=4024 RepID=A0AA39VZ42_ACESA|nr:hypothetical protein LWI29_027432 [Acer saccharum]
MKKMKEEVEDQGVKEYLWRQVQLLMCIGMCEPHIPMDFVFTECDEMKVSIGRRPDENVRSFQGLIRETYDKHPPWIMTSSVTGLGRDELLLHVRAKELLGSIEMRFNKPD